MLKCLLTETDGFIDIQHDQTHDQLTVRVDRSKISTVGKPALGEMLLKLHIYRSTADVRPCRMYYEDLSMVEEKHLEWRKIVIRNAEPGWNYVHANTFMENGTVVLKEYEATAEGIIQSWADRKV
jgi:dipeptidyl-peptidase-3